MVLAIAAIIASYPLSQKAINKQLEIAEKYYLQDDDCAVDTKNPSVHWHETLVETAGICFVAGLVLILVFFALNLKR